MEITEQEKQNLIMEIAKMGEADWEGTIGSQRPKDPILWNQVEKIRKSNTRRLKEIVEMYGWPTKSLVGNAASHLSWYIAQHADHDINFQEECLRLMEQLPKGEVELYDLAHLVDRVRINKGKPQVYGTQFLSVGGVRKMCPVENPESLDGRRISMGLNEPFEEHHKRMIGKG